LTVAWRRWQNRGGNAEADAGSSETFEDLCHTLQGVTFGKTGVLIATAVTSSGLNIYSSHISFYRNTYSTCVCMYN
jgi:hypothetical protein